MRDRRLGYRIQLPLMLTSYVRERPVKVLCSDLSDTGIGLAAVAGLAPAPGAIVGLEIALPGLDDDLWAAGEVCYRGAERHNDLATGLGVRFTAMARAHARMLRDFCIESRRGHLASMLGRIRGSIA
jgi:c-di-GMP-binding flagellar brake protein YcgR